MTIEYNIIIIIKEIECIGIYIISLNTPHSPSDPPLPNPLTLLLLINLTDVN
jgi:hypothetical protein